jgi:DNA-binding IclR family transcriptional regulator
MRRDILGGKPELDSKQRTRVATRADLDAQLAGIRADGVFREFSEMDDALGCIAVPWPHYGTPASLAVVGDLDEIESKHLVIERALRAAAARSADRDDVTRAAASALADE